MNVPFPLLGSAYGLSVAYASSSQVVKILINKHQPLESAGTASL